MSITYIGTPGHAKQLIRILIGKFENLRDAVELGQFSAVWENLESIHSTHDYIQNIVHLPLLSELVQRLCTDFSVFSRFFSVCTGIHRQLVLRNHLAPQCNTCSKKLKREGGLITRYISQFCPECSYTLVSSESQLDALQNFFDKIATCLIKCNRNQQSLVIQNAFNKYLNTRIILQKLPSVISHTH